MTPHVRTPVQALRTHDTTRIDDIRISAVRPLITPALLQEWLPAPDAAVALVESSRAAISRLLHGADDRLLVVVGPCSIHDHDQAVAYARELKAQADALAQDLLLVMRVYFEKPRTTLGWKGYINDPHLDGSFAINEGLEMARKLLLDLLAMGLPVGTEFLDLLAQAGLLQQRAGGCDVGAAVIGVPAAAQDDVAVVIAARFENRCLSHLGQTQKGVCRARG